MLLLYLLITCNFLITIFDWYLFHNVTTYLQKLMKKIKINRKQLTIEEKMLFVTFYMLLYSKLCCVALAHRH